MSSHAPVLSRRSLLTAGTAVLALTAVTCSKTPEPSATHHDASSKQSASAAKAHAKPDTSFVFHAPGKIVAFGDVHGDLQATRGALRVAGAIDDKDRWIGGNLFVVQVGDVLDRGDDEVQILDLFDKLGKEAKAAGGRVFVLAGNHEVMNVQGDFRYVTKKGFGIFNLMSNLPNPASPRFMRFPVQARSRAAAFLPGGPFAKRLAAFPVAIVVNDTVFVHGGLLPQHVSYGIGRINRETKAWMLAKRRALPEPMRGEDAPNWTRVYSTPPVSAGTCRMLDKVLGSVHGKRMVVGHTPQKGGITSACDQKVWRVDIGLGSFYGSTPAQVLQVSGEKVTVLTKPAVKEKTPAAAASH